RDEAWSRWPAESAGNIKMAHRSAYVDGQSSPQRGEPKIAKAKAKAKTATAKRAAKKATKSKAKAVPSGMHALSPHLVCAGAADAIAFYKKAFDAVEMIRMPGNDGKLMHACVQICGSSVMLVDE